MRGIVKEARFEEELSEIEPDAKRADEFLEGAEWVLGREPRRGTCVGDDSCIWFLPMHDVSDAPSLIVYYTFNESKVYLLSIQIAP